MVNKSEEGLMHEFICESERAEVKLRIRKWRQSKRDDGRRLAKATFSKGHSAQLSSLNSDHFDDSVGLGGWRRR
jgi:hypothetical protein